MQLTTIGLNHETAPLDIRAKLAFPADILREAVNSLRTNVAAEAVILSTCNRTELYCVGSSESIIQWLADYQNVAVEEIRPYLYVLGCSETIHHAFRVACGLDSMVLGEPQILGQMKDAVRIAQEENSIGTWLNALFQKTFATAKEVRTNTNVGDNVVSMASAGLRMAENIFANIENCKILFVGAGEMIETVATYFAARQPAQIAIANRTIQRAETLLEKLNFNGAREAYRLEDLPQILADYDIVIASTASKEPVIHHQTMQNAMAARHHQTVFMLDLAVPRDIEAQCADLENVVLRTVDDIADVVANGKQARQQAALAAEEMVSAKVADFISWQQHRQRVPLICALRNEGEKARQQVLANAMKQLAKGAPAEEVLERLSVQLTNKLLHSPTHALNKAAANEHNFVDAVTQIYRLQ